MKNNFIDSSKFCFLKGISRDKFRTQGIASLPLDFGSGINQFHDFHVIDDEVPITPFVILGRDFLVKFRCALDFENWTMRINIFNTLITIPLYNHIDEDVIVIPPRCEIIRKINSSVNEDSLILSHELQDGVFCANSIIRDTAYVKLINTNEFEVHLKNFSPTFEPLSDYHVFSLNAIPENPTSSSSTDENHRIECLLKELNLSTVPEFARKGILDICSKYNDIFSLQSDKLTVNNFYKQKISLIDNSPVFIRNYRTPKAQMPEIDSQVEELVKQDCIEPSVSSYNSPLLLVPKKSTDSTKKWRLVVDFRELNKRIMGDKFPLPRIDEILDELGRAKYFSTLDLKNSFHQIELDEESRPLTAFSSKANHYHFKRLPFGLKISANSFQRMLSIALSGLSPDCSFLYVDDIIVFGCSVNHHNHNLIKIFERLRKFNLKLNPAKCSFLNKEVTYLGHLVTDKGILPDPKKYNAIKIYPVPQNADDVRRFIAFCNYYRRFVPNFAKIATPLNNLLKKNTKFSWTPECNAAFIELKNKLMSPQILSYPDDSKSYILTTDSSQFAFGAVLSQGEIGSDKPIAFASRSLTKYEIKKPIIEKELLAVHWAINYFRSYLYGKRFTVITDHRPLVGLFSNRTPSTKLNNVRLDLSDYNFDICYRPGHSNNADALSRIKITSEELQSLIPENTVQVVTRSMTKKNTNSAENKNSFTPSILDDPVIWNTISLTEIKGLIRIEFQISNDKKTRAHDITIEKGGIRNKIFLKIKCTYEIVRKYLSDIFKEIKREISKEMNADFRVAFSLKDELFSYISVEDFKVLYNLLQQNESNKLKIVLFNPPIIIRNKNEMLKLISDYHDTPTGGHFGIAKTMKRLKNFFVWKGMRKMIRDYINSCIHCAMNKKHRNNKEPLQITDTPSTSFEIVQADLVGPLVTTANDNKYALTLQCELTKFIEVIPVPNKECNTIAKALVENFILKFGHFKILKTDLGKEFVNETFEKMCELLHIDHVRSTPYHHETLGSVERMHRVLNSYLLTFCKENDWDVWIPYFVFSYNTTPHADTNFTPFELIFGKLTSLNVENQISTPIYNFDSYVSELRYRLKVVHEKTKLLLDKNKQKRQDRDKNKSLDFKVNDLVLITNENRTKMDSVYLGPYVIIERLGVNSRVKNVNNGKISVIHNNRLKFFK